MLPQQVAEPPHKIIVRYNFDALFQYFYFTSTLRLVDRIQIHLARNARPY